MSVSTRLKSFLEDNQIAYSVMTHTTAYTAQGAAAAMKISGKELALTQGKGCFPILSWRQRLRRRTKLAFRLQRTRTETRVRLRQFVPGSIRLSTEPT